MTQQPITLYTDSADGTRLTATPDPSGWWVLDAGRGVFISPDMLTALRQLFAEHGPIAHATQALQDAAPEEDCPMTDQPDRCDRCLCDECNGTLGQHAGAMCTCEDCTGYPGTACREFHVPGRIPLLFAQLAPLLSAHLNERTRVRCLFVAHAAHHALNDYDRKKTR